MDEIDKKTKIVKMFGEVLSDITLNDLKKQAGNEDEFDELILQIASPGGSVSEGLEIMVWLDSLSAKGKTIITVVVANAYSIASLIMLSADIKLISKYGKVMVHNPMVPELKYVNANDLEKHIEELRDLETNMYALYEMFTGMETSKIKELMDNETYLQPQQAVDFGFADLVIDIKPKTFEMTTNTNKQINMSKTINVLNRVIGMVNKSEYVNQTYADTEGGEIEIFQTDPATYKKGDRTSLENGTVTLSDGAKVTTENFLITEIDRTAEVEPVDGDFNTGAAPIIEEEAVVEAPSVEKPVEEVPVSTDPAKVIEKTESTVTTKEIQNTEIKEVITWELSVVNESFALGDKVEYKPTEDFPEANGVGVGEFMLEDGRKILTDSESIIQFIKPAVAEAPISEDVEAKKTDEKEMKVEAMESDDKKEMKADKDSDFEAKITALETKNKELEAKLGEIENKLSESAKEVENKLDEVNKFQEVAAKAIDTVASNMSSGFKPEAKASLEQSIGESIFDRALKNRGLR